MELYIVGTIIIGSYNSKNNMPVPSSVGLAREDREFDGIGGGNLADCLQASGA